MNRRIFLISCFMLSGLNISYAQDSKPASVPFQVQELHPIFRLSGEDVRKAAKQGIDASRKSNPLDWLAKKYKQNPKWTRGKSGKSRESAVWAYNFEGLAISMQACEAARKYEKSPVPESFLTNGMDTIRLDFEVLLTSIPHLGTYRWDKDRLADEREVTAVKFVLSDDKGNNYTADSTSAGATTSTMTFSGTAAVPTTEQVNSSAYAYATGTGPNGTSIVSVYGSSVSTYNRTQYVSWTAEHPYYQARYFVQFPLFNEDGHARITPDVKKITLHIITDAGELSTEYKLTANPKK